MTPVRQALLALRLSGIFCALHLSLCTLFLLALYLLGWVGAEALQVAARTVALLYAPILAGAAIVAGLWREPGYQNKPMRPSAKCM